VKVLPHKRKLLIAAVLIVPPWYFYRTVTDERTRQINWNAIVGTQSSGTDGENEAKKQAEAAELAARKKDTAEKLNSCIEWAKSLEPKHAELVREREKYTKHIDGLLRSEDGHAIAQNPDYLLAFRYLLVQLNGPLFGEDLLKTIRGVKDGCEAERTKQGSKVESDFEKVLESQASSIQFIIDSLQKSQQKIAKLVLVANAKSDALETAVSRQEIADLVERLKKAREYELHNPGVSYAERSWMTNWTCIPSADGKCR
jgi:hypothetical protein